jgi:hypothetical protein
MGAKIHCPQYVEFTHNETIDMNDLADVLFGEKSRSKFFFLNKYIFHFSNFLKKDVLWAKDLSSDCLVRILGFDH